MHPPVHGAARPAAQVVALAVASAMFPLYAQEAPAAAAESTAESAAESRAATPDAVQLDNIVVTAQKRAQKLKDVPISIAAFSGETIEQQNFTDFERLSTRTPGFFVQQQTDSAASFVMRGIEAGNAGAVSEPSISFFLNDVDTSRSRGMLKELFDIERVEVAKGPQGTLYGRGAQIGAVAVYTRKADPAELQWSAEGILGNDNLRSATGMINLPIVQDELALRVVARKRDRDGYANNLGGGGNSTTTTCWPRAPRCAGSRPKTSRWT